MKVINAVLMSCFLLSFLLVGCASDDKKPEECNTVSDTSAAVLEAINTLIDPELPLHCSKEKVFSVNGQEVSFVLVRYGYLHDCLSGCVAGGFLCSVVDQSGASLYTAKWLDPTSQPLSIPPDCAELSGAPGGNTLTECQDPPPGFEHPVTQTAEFQSFKQKKIDDEDSYWRGCFR